MVSIKGRLHAHVWVLPTVMCLIETMHPVVKYIMTNKFERKKKSVRTKCSYIVNIVEISQVVAPSHSGA